MSRNNFEEWQSESNYRLFDDNDIGWIQSLKCLKRCGMGIDEMLSYKDLCMQSRKTTSTPTSKAAKFPTQVTSAITHSMQPIARLSDFKQIAKHAAPQRTF